MRISRRKSEHIRIALEHDVSFRTKTAGFEAYEFIHCALPEMNYDEISTKTEFLGKRLSFPMMIGAITGGYKGAISINQQIAEVCRRRQIAICVGSQRQMIENDRHLESFRIVRKTAPNEVIVGNVGAAQVAGLKDLSPILKMVDLIEADAIAVHLNPLQELLQHEGDKLFRGVLKGIEKLVHGLTVPVMVKEVGCGISEEVAKRLSNAGVKYIDVAGAGGTSWAAIESFRMKKRDLALRFRDWGIPTVESLQMVSRVKGVHMIASGGIRNGQSVAKALALGAELCGAALPFLRVIFGKKREGLTSLLDQWQEELKIVMFVTGCKRILDLQRKGVLVKKKD